MENQQNSLTQELNALLEKTKTQEISIKMIIDTLAGKGQAVMIIAFSLPFCLPIQIPGFSTPFGILLAFIGLRIAFGRHIWLPQKLLEKNISHDSLKRISSIAIKVNEKLRSVISTRMVWLVKNPPLHMIHGLTITALSVLLALPLPIPFTNLLSALPLLAFGFALLEDDGLMIIIAYSLTLLCLSAFAALIWLIADFS